MIPYYVVMPELFEYDVWNSKKKYLNLGNSTELYFKEREVWWCSVGLNVGFEENGKGELFNRPVLILRKFGSKTFLGIPMPTIKKTGSFYYSIELRGVKSVCLLTHIRLFDFRRLTQKIGTLDKESFQGIRKALKSLI